MGNGENIRLDVFRTGPPFANIPDPVVRFPWLCSHIFVYLNSVLVPLYHCNIVWYYVVTVPYKYNAQYESAHPQCSHLYFIPKLISYNWKFIYRDYIFCMFGARLILQLRIDFRFIFMFHRFRDGPIEIKQRLKNGKKQKKQQLSSNTDDKIINDE